MATCDNNGTYSGNAASFTLTTAHAPISQGSFSIQYYNEDNCTTTVPTFNLAGPMGTCVNTTATGSGLAVSYKATEVWNCDGQQYTMNAGVLGGDNCDAQNLASFPVTVGRCTYSSSTSKWYIATCSSAAWTDTTIIITTTHAPISQGSFSIQYYNEDNCPTTVPTFNLAGPMGTCVNTTATGSGLAVSYKATEVWNCDGQKYTMNAGVLGGDNC